MTLKRLVRSFLWMAGTVLALVLISVAVLIGMLRGSLPKLDGQLRAAGLRASVTIERDPLNHLGTGDRENADRQRQAAANASPLRLSAGGLSLLVTPGYRSFPVARFAPIPLSFHLRLEFDPLQTRRNGQPTDSRL